MKKRKLTNAMLDEAWNIGGRERDRINPGYVKRKANGDVTSRERTAQRAGMRAAFEYLCRQLEIAELKQCRST